MRAIIIGAGKVGYNIAQTLSQEGHDVIVVEQDEERVHVLEETLDVQVVMGNGASSAILEKIEVSKSNLVVAVTESDELNMIACMLAKQYGVKRTVARVRNPEYATDSKLASNPALGIDLLINPERVAAMEIAKIIAVPEAVNVNYYAHGKIQLLELKVEPTNPIIGKMLKDMRGKFHFLVAAILRNERLIIPQGNDSILVGDNLFIMAKTTDMLEVERLLGFNRKVARKVMLLGGSRIAFYLAVMLEKKGLEVKIIEKEYKHCKKLASSLEKTIILHGDGSDIDLLRDEGINETDIFVALTEDDKLNVLVSLLADRLGAKKTIAQIRRSDYVPLIETVGIDVAISPRILTAEAVLKFVRNADFLSISILEKGCAEVYEVVVSQKMTKLVDQKICDIRFPKGALIGAIFRNEEAIIPSGNDYLRLDDRITIFTSANLVRKIEHLLS